MKGKQIASVRKQSSSSSFFSSFPPRLFIFLQASISQPVHFTFGWRYRANIRSQQLCNKLKVIETGWDISAGGGSGSSGVTVMSVQQEAAEGVAGNDGGGPSSGSSEQQCVIVLLFHTCKTPGSWQSSSGRRYSTSFSRMSSRSSAVQVKKMKKRENPEL